MPYSITYSTKILTLAIAPLLFISVPDPCSWSLYYGARCVYFLVPSGRRGILFFLRVQIYTFSNTFTKKIELLSDIILLCQGYCWIGKKHKQGIQLSYGVFNETKQLFEILICFWCQWKPLSNLFLIKFWKFLVLYLGCGCMAFVFTTQNKYQNHSTKTTIYISKYWERSVKGSLISISSQSKKILHLLINIFYVYGPNLSKNSL